MVKIKAFFIVLLLASVCLFSVYLQRSIIFPLEYKEHFATYCEQYNISLSLAFAVAKCESNFDANAVSSSGAIGVMQLMPETAYYIADKINYRPAEIDLFDAQINIMLGCAYLSYLSERFTIQKHIIMAYNAGEGRVSDWIESGKERFEIGETRIYYSKVSYAKFVYDNLV